MTGVLVKWGHLDTDTHSGECHMQMGGSDKGDDSTNQGMPEIASSPPEAGGRGLE